MHVDKESPRDSFLDNVGKIAKKVFALSISTYFFTLFVNQVLGGGITPYIHELSILAVILVSFTIMLLFHNHPISNKRMSKSDWGLIFFLLVIGTLFQLLKRFDLGYGNSIMASILLIFSIGLVFYVWSGKDQGVNFVLFDHDRRLKFATYIKHSGKEWLTSILIWLILFGGIIVAHTFLWPSDTDQNAYSINKQKAFDVLVTPTPADITQPTFEPTQSEEPTVAPTDEPTTAPTDEPTPTSEPTTEPTPEPTPTPLPPVQLDRDPNDYQLYVLNGSGVPGAASEIKSKLEEREIIVDYVGDAPPYNYDHVQINYQTGFKDVADAAYSVLKPLYDTATVAEFGPGDRFSQYNVVIVHGE
ncbi:LytR C-terminal domain-containing protein [candidate division WWE3 bacterium]|uniref:LytR C-terminal domain-containing protein n=1 Tax=candidate division WWE3 bacterium TaxID=2053526 RepID=A0A955RP54_UNCKA|nr:LytR C-terminal domain-containing protein [candidate division WWE3 bacterium]